MLPITNPPPISFRHTLLPSTSSSRAITTSLALVLAMLSSPNTAAGTGFPLFLYFSCFCLSPLFLSPLFLSAVPGYNLCKHRNPPQGYKVSLVTFTNGVPSADEPFLKYAGPGETGTGWHRPVGMISPLFLLLSRSILLLLEKTGFLFLSSLFIFHRPCMGKVLRSRLPFGHQ